MTHGEGPTYSNASVAMQVLDARYATKRDFIISYITDKIFLPTALANEFYEITQAQLDHGVRVNQEFRKPIIPKFEWLSKVNLTETGQRMSYVLQLYQATGMPLKIVCDILQVDYQEVLSWLKKEKGTIADPAWRKLEQMIDQQKVQKSLSSETGGAYQGGSTPQVISPTSGEGDEPESMEEEMEETVEEQEEEQKQLRKGMEHLKPKQFSLEDTQLTKKKSIHGEKVKASEVHPLLKDFSAVSIQDSENVNVDNSTTISTPLQENSGNGDSGLQE
jgi:hypothetical protein